MENNEQPIVEAKPEVTGNAKAYSILAYISILWLIGLLASPEKDLPFVKNHVNNGIILTIISAVSMIIAQIPFVGKIISFIISVITLVFAIMGIVKACKEELFKLPVIGDNFTIIK